jgi:hypothetical protein
MLAARWSAIGGPIGRADEIRDCTDQFHPPLEAEFGAVLARDGPGQRIHAHNLNADHRIA